MKQSELDEQIVDLIIIGAGASGLSLLLELHHINDNHRVKVLERASGPNSDRIWSFWQPLSNHHADTLPDYLHSIIAKKWTSWCLSIDDNCHVMRDSNYHYSSLRAEAFSEFAVECAKDNALHDIVFNTEVVALTECNGYIEVETQNQRFLAQKVIDTRPPPICTQHTGLVQCFYGKEVVVDIDTFDDSIVQLMGALKCSELGIEFVYILPFSPKHALIEFTCFSASVVSMATLKKRLDEVIHEIVRSDNFHILREENAVLPMYRVNQNVSAKNPCIVHAGISGGAMRASTGYSFLNCHRWAQTYAVALKDKKTPSNDAPINWVYQKMDAVMLKVLRDDIRLGVHIFGQMFKKVKPDSFVRFMTERATWLDVCKVILAMPKWVFARAAIAILFSHLRLSKKQRSNTK